jgi:long-chain acyl-CoA synthetase
MTWDRAALIEQMTTVGQPHELIEIDGLRDRVRAFRHTPANLGEMYASARSDRDFLIHGEERLTFEEVWSKSAGLAARLARDYDVAKGDRVAISMRNFPEWVLAFNAATMLGAIAVAFNAHWQPQDMTFALRDSEPKVLLIDRERCERLQRCASDVRLLPSIVVRAEGPLPEFARHFEELAFDDEPPRVEVLPDDDAVMLYTSGSSGPPKGAVSTHRNILTALLSWELDAKAINAISDDQSSSPDARQVALLGIPLFHVAGLHVCLLQCYRAQRALVSMYKWDPNEACRLIEKERVTHFSGPPAVTGDLADAALRTPYDLSSLVTVGGGGAPRAPEQLRAMVDALPHSAPSIGFGMTETNGMGAGIYGEDYLQRPTSSGRLSAILDGRIVDDEGLELPANTRGELQVRGASIMRGYWNRALATEQAFIDGWFRTGDVATFDDEGYLYIVDRIKDLVIRGGENIGCGAVEAALLEHPDVVEASVYGVPDDRLGEEVGATVYARAALTAEALEAFLRPRLAAFEVPRFVEILTSPLLRTASGKILKRELREATIERLARSKSEKVDGARI